MEDMREEIKDHEKRIQKLEISEATVNERLITLFKKMDDLTSWLKALVMLGGTTLVAFFIWFIQSLASK